MSGELPLGLTRRGLLQWTAGTAAAGVAGCMGTDDESPGVTITESYLASPDTATTRPQATETSPTETGEATDSTETQTTTEASETEDAEPTETETETDSETETETTTATTRQLRIIAAEGAAAFEYSFTIDGDAELVTTGDYNAVPKDETANNRGEEIIENDDGTVTIKGWVADGGGDTFRFTGEIIDSEILGPASVFVDGELVEETDSTSRITSCRTIDEPGEYVLTEDLAGSTGVCIDIRADDVTLDGDGHTIAGSDRQGTGIAVSASNVVIRNVTVRDFAVGMDLDGARVRHCNVTENTTGIRVLSPSSRGSVFGSEITNNGDDGIVLEASESIRQRIQNNRVAANGRYGLVITASDADVYVNVIEDNGEWGVWVEDSEVFFDSNEVRSNAGGTHVVGQGIFDNEIVARNRGTGVSIAGEAELWATSIRDNDGDGLRVDQSPHFDGRAKLERCHITANGENGIDAAVDLAVRESNIAGNAAFGVRYSGDGVAEARNNYWGAADGPSSPDDPDAPFKDPEADEHADGSGDAVSEGDTPGVSNVRFAPWRETEV